MTNIDDMSTAALEKELKNRKKQVKDKKGGRTSKITLLIIYFTTLIIIAAYFYCVVVVQVVPEGIIEWWFKCVIGELGFLGGIKAVKTIWGK